MAKEKHLYFGAGSVDGTGSTEEVVMVPVSGVSHYEMVSTTELDVWFNSGVAPKMVTTHDTVLNKVRLTVVAASHKEVLNSIAQEIGNPDTLAPAMIVVTDAENSIWINPNITAAAISIAD